jgi:hypothetical protein
MGFAVAVNVDPDVLLIDEVLAVGDENFQRKCLERIHQFQDEGRTIVFVTHASDQVRQLCDRAVVLDHGHVVAIGEPPEAIRIFRDHLYASRREREAASLAAADDAAAAEAAPVGPATSEEDELSHGERQEAKRTLQVRITDVEVVGPGGSGRSHLLPAEPLTVRVHFAASRPTSDVVFGIAIHDAQDGKLLFGANTVVLDADVPTLDGAGVVEFSFGSVPLLDGTYPITLGIHSHDEGTVYDWQDQKHWFTVLNPDRTVGTVALPLEVTVKA